MESLNSDLDASDFSSCPHLLLLMKTARDLREMLFNELQGCNTKKPCHDDQKTVLRIWGLCTQSPWGCLLPDLEFCQGLSGPKWSHSKVRWIRMRSWEHSPSISMADHQHQLLYKLGHKLKAHSLTPCNMPKTWPVLLGKTEAKIPSLASLISIAPTWEP